MDQRLEGMMDCIKKAFLEGSARGLEFRKMRHGIIVEMIRLGLTKEEIKEQLLEWNKRCERVLGPSEQRTQLGNYVEWVFKRIKEPRIGCRAMCDYCLGTENCEFFKKKYVLNRKVTEPSAFYWSEITKFLDERYAGHPGLILKLILAVLRDYQQEKGTGEVIFISFRKICQILADKHSYHPSPMELSRKMAILVEEGIIEIAIHGKSGTFKQLANGYRFLPWSWPQGANSPTTTHINPFV